MPEPKWNTAYTFDLALVDTANRPQFKANPTLAAGDFKISIDEGAFANLATLPTVAPAAGRNVKVVLSATEMIATRVVVQAVDAAGAEWDEVTVTISPLLYTTEELLRPTVAGRTLDVAADGTAGPTAVQIADEAQTRTFAAVTSVLDKTGYALSSAGIIAVWAAATRELSASGNTATAAAVSAALASSFSALAPSLVADAVWDELTAGHVVAGSTGEAVAAGGATAGAIADAVWDELTSGHVIAGSTGQAVAAGGSAGDPWITALPGVYAAGSAGEIIGNRVVASVTGAVGSVAGNVAGNVVGSVASVTGAVGSVTTVNDKTGYRMSATGVDDILRTALPEAYAADGAAGTLTQLLYMIQQLMAEKSITTTTMTVKKLDGTTTAATFTLNSAVAPTAITRAT